MWQLKYWKKFSLFVEVGLHSTCPFSPWFFWVYNWRCTNYCAAKVGIVSGQDFFSLLFIVCTLGRREKEKGNLHTKINTNNNSLLQDKPQGLNISGFLFLHKWSQWIIVSMFCAVSHSQLPALFLVPWKFSHFCVPK